MTEIKMLRHIDRQIEYASKYGGPTHTSLLSGSGVYSSPGGCRYIVVEAVGGGGSGAKHDLTSTPGGGGGGGGYFCKVYPAGKYGYTVGTGGVGPTVQNTNGQAGTATIFNTDSAGGGAQGQVTRSGAGGTSVVSNAILCVKGGYGSIGPSDCTSSGGSTYFGTGPPSTRTSDVIDITRLDGQKGSGGSGVGDSLARGGHGGSGYILITEYY